MTLRDFAKLLTSPVSTEKFCKNSWFELSIPILLVRLTSKEEEIITSKENENAIYDAR